LSVSGRLAAGGATGSPKSGWDPSKFDASSTGGARVGSCDKGSAGGSATVTDRDGAVEGTGRVRTANGAELEGWASVWRALVAALVVLAGGDSVRRVTVPGSEKSRNCSGPTVSGAGVGAGVTTLVVVCWADRGGVARLASASAAHQVRIVARPPIRINPMVLKMCPQSGAHRAERAMNGALHARHPRPLQAA
jgi:hypothetical protein